MESPWMALSKRSGRPDRSAAGALYPTRRGFLSAMTGFSATQELEMGSDYILLTLPQLSLSSTFGPVEAAETVASPNNEDLEADLLRDGCIGDWERVLLRSGCEHL
jgi:hypothetical protein